MAAMSLDSSLHQMKAQLVIWKQTEPGDPMYQQVTKTKEDCKVKFQ